MGYLCFVVVLFQKAVVPQYEFCCIMMFERLNAVHIWHSSLDFFTYPQSCPSAHKNGEGTEAGVSNLPSLDLAFYGEFTPKAFLPSGHLIHKQIIWGSVLSSVESSTPWRPSSGHSEIRTFPAWSKRRENQYVKWGFTPQVLKS